MLLLAVVLFYCGVVGEGSEYWVVALEVVQVVELAEVVALEVCIREMRIVVMNYKEKSPADHTTAILDRKKSANSFIVDESTKDDNSLIELNPFAMEKLNF